MQQRARLYTAVLEECTQRHRRVHPGGRSLVPLAVAPEERRGGGRGDLRQSSGSNGSTLHLPSPHQRQVVMVAAFTVAVTCLALIGAA